MKARPPCNPRNKIAQVVRPRAEGGREDGRGSTQRLETDFRPALSKAPGGCNSYPAKRMEKENAIKVFRWSSSENYRHSLVAFSLGSSCWSCFEFTILSRLLKHVVLQGDPSEPGPRSSEHRRFYLFGSPLQVESVFLIRPPDPQPIAKDPRDPLGGPPVTVGICGSPRPWVTLRPLQQFVDRVDNCHDSDRRAVWHSLRWLRVARSRCGGGPPAFRAKVPPPERRQSRSRSRHTPS